MPGHASPSRSRALDNQRRNISGRCGENSGQDGSPSLIWSHAVERAPARGHPLHARGLGRIRDGWHFAAEAPPLRFLVVGPGFRYGIGARDRRFKSSHPDHSCQVIEVLAWCRNARSPRSERQHREKLEIRGDNCPSLPDLYLARSVRVVAG
jgi:hypothetical protein